MNAERCILTPHVKANGLSAVDPGRMGRGIAAVEEAFGLSTGGLSAERFYTAAYLPPRGDLGV